MSQHSPSHLLRPADSGSVGIARRSSDFTALTRAVRAAGLLDRTPRRYVGRFVATAGLYLGVIALAVAVGNSWWQLAVAALGGVALTQAAFIGHDSAHGQISGDARLNRLVAVVSGTAMVGLSVSWWVDQHNRHHANPNKQHSDPDIGDGVLALTTEQVAGRTGGFGRWLTAHQAWPFLPLLALEGLNLHVASLTFLLRERRGNRAELLLLLAHLGVYTSAVFLLLPTGKAFAFLAVQQAVLGVYMGLSFAPNHKGMTIIAADQQLDFLRRQVLTSRNVRGGVFTDWLLGGLNYQIEHHLFPSMPRSNLRRVQPIVRRFCADHGVTYTETSLIESCRVAMKCLHGVGAPLRSRTGSVSR